MDPEGRTEFQFGSLNFGGQPAGAGSLFFVTEKTRGHGERFFFLQIPVSSQKPAKSGWNRTVSFMVTADRPQPHARDACDGARTHVRAVVAQLPQFSPPDCEADRGEDDRLYESRDMRRTSKNGK